MFSDYFQNKVVLITGGSMGIGKTLAEKILQAGGQVVVTGRNAERLNSLSDSWPQYKNQLLTVCLDVADEAGLEQLIQTIKTRFGGLDVLINNAALSAHGNLESTDARVIHTLVDTNIKGLLFTTKAVLPLLRERQGCVLFISSLAGLYGLPGYSLYSLSKMALRALRQSLTPELLQAGILPAIAYVGFTENESDKRTLNAAGEMEVVPNRPARFTFSREKTATLLLSQIAGRKKVVIQGKLGKLTYFLALYFPFILHFILNRNYRKTDSSQLKKHD